MNSIPRYPESRGMELSDKPFFDEAFARMQPRISEFTFAGLYLFREAHYYRITLVGDAVVLLGSGYDGETYFLPPIAGDVETALSRLFGNGLTLYGADDLFLSRYGEMWPLEATPDRDSFDYLYLRQELADLPGNRYHKKKNRVNYFTGHHAYEVVPLADGHLADCLQLLEYWQRVRSGFESRSLLPEVLATREALQQATVLGLEGLVVLVEGSAKGFVLGERLNRDTSVCHFEKADPFMEGLPQLLDREFNRLLFTDCTYVNREQDLGEAGLRDAKLSYHPVELVRKFRVRRA